MSSQLQHMSATLEAARPELDELQAELAAVEQELAELAAWRVEVHEAEQALAEHTRGAP